MQGWLICRYFIELSVCKKPNFRKEKKALNNHNMRNNSVANSNQMKSGRFWQSSGFLQLVVLFWFKTMFLEIVRHFNYNEGFMVNILKHNWNVSFITPHLLCKWTSQKQRFNPIWTVVITIWKDMYLTGKRTILSVFFKFIAQILLVVSN